MPGTAELQFQSHCELLRKVELYLGRAEWLLGRENSPWGGSNSWETAEVALVPPEKLRWTLSLWVSAPGRTHKSCLLPTMLSGICIPQDRNPNNTKTPAWGCKVQDFGHITRLSMTHSDI